MTTTTQSSAPPVAGGTPKASGGTSGATVLFAALAFGLFVYVLYQALNKRTATRVAAPAVAMTVPRRPDAPRDVVSSQTVLPSGPLKRGARAQKTPSVGGSTYQKQVPIVLPLEVVLDATTGGAVANGTAGGFEVRAACVRGLDHASSGEAGDDVALVVQHSDVLYAVISDGMGSQANSRHVARHIVDAFAKSVRSSASSPDQVLAAAMSAAATASKAAAKSYGSGAATVVAAAFVPHANGATVHGACIGDSGLFLRTQSGVIQLLGDQDTGEGTRGLPQHTQPVFESFQTEPTDVVFLASDGFHTGLDDPQRVLETFLARSWGDAPTPVDFLDAVAFDGDYYYDDRSVVAAWRLRST